MFRWCNMNDLGIHVITTTMIMISSLSLIFIVLMYNLYKDRFSKHIKLPFYGILLVGTYNIIPMFKENATRVKIDILTAIENTNKYNGFYDSTDLFIVTLVGGILGSIFYIATRYVQEYNIRKRDW